MYPSSWQTDRTSVVPRIEMLPRVGLRQAGERAQKCRLPCSIVAEDCVEPSCSKFSADAAQRGEAAELLDQRCQRNDGRNVHAKGRYHVGAGALTRPAERSSARFAEGIGMDQMNEPTAGKFSRKPQASFARPPGRGRPGLRGFTWRIVCPAAGARISRRTWLAAVWRGRRRRGQSCHRPGPGSCL